MRSWLEPIAALDRRTRSRYGSAGDADRGCRLLNRYFLPLSNTANTIMDSSSSSSSGMKFGLFIVGGCLLTAALLVMDSPVNRGAPALEEKVTNSQGADRKNVDRRIVPAGESSPQTKSQSAQPTGLTELATFGSGCFWCGEAVFERLQGVVSAESGFAGGHVDNPTYRQVIGGRTGHAEVVQVRYDPAIISYAELLQVFWKTHDPTTLNRQGADVGPQYRSIVLYHDDQQRETAEQYKKKLDEAGAFNDPIVTEIASYRAFYPAKADHQDFYRRNQDNRYCRAVIVPKLDKLEKVFADKLKEKP